MGDGLRLVFAMAALMWVLEVVDVLAGHALDSLGIVPRTLGGLLGIALAPLLHFGFGHLAANTVPFVVLGATIALAGAARVLAVTAFAAVASGLGVWLLSPSASVTAGASGVVFGYAAYLIVRGFVSRRIGQLTVGAVVIAVFGAGLLVGLLPQAGVATVGHLFGAAGGAVAGRVLHDPGQGRGAVTRTTSASGRRTGPRRTRPPTR